MFFVYVLSCVVTGDGPDILLTTDSGRRPLCSCLVFWSIASGSPYRHLIYEHLDCKSRESVSYTSWRGGTDIVAKEKYNENYNFSLIDTNNISKWIKFFKTPGIIPKVPRKSAVAMFKLMTV